MNKTIVLLANSWKLGGRCLAGIHLIKNAKGGYDIVKKNGRPEWIRPVSDQEDGQISLENARQYKNLDVVELINCVPKPQGFQSENHVVESINRISSVRYTQNNFNALCDLVPSNIFGNHGKAVHLEQIKTISYSLMLVETSTFSGYEKKYDTGRAQKRGVFICGDTGYDLAITDPTYELGNEIGKKVFVTISLGLLHEGWHSKLLAGVFCI